MVQRHGAETIARASPLHPRQATLHWVPAAPALKLPWGAAGEWQGCDHRDSGSQPLTIPEAMSFAKLTLWLQGYWLSWGPGRWTSLELSGTTGGRGRQVCDSPRRPGALLCPAHTTASRGVGEQLKTSIFFFFWLCWGLNSVFGTSKQVFYCLSHASTHTLFFWWDWGLNSASVCKAGAV
jgi:hypothetical protein